MGHGRRRRPEWGRTRARDLSLPVELALSLSLCLSVGGPLARSLIRWLTFEFLLTVRRGPIKQWPLGLLAGPTLGHIQRLWQPAEYE